MTVDNGLMTVVRCVTAVVVVACDDVVGMGFAAGMVDVTAFGVDVGAWLPIWIAEGTCVAAPPVPVSVTKRMAPAATNAEQIHRPHCVPVSEDLRPCGRAREAAAFRAASFSWGLVTSQSSYI